MSFTYFRAGDVLVSDVLYLAAGIVILGKLLTGNDRDLAPADARRGSTIILVGAILLIASGTLSSIRSWEPMESITVVLRFAWITLAWFWIMRSVCRNRDDLSLLVRAWKLSSLVNACAALLGLFGLAFVSTYNGDRQVGLSGHPNHLSGHLSATFIFFLLAVPVREDGRGRLWWLIALGLVTTANFSSGSITGVMAMAGAIVAVGACYLATRKPRRARRQSPLAPIAFILVIMVGGTLLFTSDLSVVERLAGYQEGDTYVVESVDSRGERNSRVTENFERYLVVGLGFNDGIGIRAFADEDDPANRNFGVHNMQLGLLYQAGLPALVGCLVILLATVRRLWALLARVDRPLYMMTLALIGSFTAVGVTSLVQPTLFDRFYWMPVALTGCLWAVRRSELQQAQTPPAGLLPRPAGPRPAQLPPGGGW
jgi:O-Antigen ligase